MAPVVVRELPSRSGDNGRLCEIIIKRLMDRVSESELVVGLSALPPRGIMGMGPSASYVLYRKLFRRHNLCRLIAGIGCYCLALVMGRWVCFVGQTRNVQEYNGRWARDPCVLRI